MTPLNEQIAEARREVAMRRRVYSRQVGRGAMTQAEADQRIAAMEDIAATLEALAKSNAPGLPL